MFSNEAFARTAERYMDTIYRVAYGWLKIRMTQMM